MWELLNGIKSWLLAINWGSLAAPKQKDVVIGVVDLSRYESNLLISLLPEEESEADDGKFIDGDYVEQSVTLTVLLRGKSNEKLCEGICKYSDLICQKIRDDCELSGIVVGSGLGDRKFYLDAGTVEKQMTAVEIPLTLLYRK